MSINEKDFNAQKNNNERNIKEAASYLNRQEPGEAEKIASSILEKDPLNFTALYYMGLALHMQGDSANSLHYLRRAFNLADSKTLDAEFINNYAIVLHAQNELDLSLIHLNEALQINPDNFNTITHKIRIFRKKGLAIYALNTAEAAYKATEKPVFERLRWYLICLQALDQYNRALNICKKVSQEFQDNAEFYTLRAQIRQRMLHYRKAEADFQYALELVPDSVDQHIAYAGFLADIGKVSAADAQYQQALSFCGDNLKLLNHYGLFLKENTRMESALEIFNRALSLDPEHAVALGNKAIVLKEMGYIEHAKQCAEHGVELAPENNDLLNNLGIILQSRGELERAAECYEKVIGRDPRHINAYFNLVEVRGMDMDPKHITYLEDVLVNDNRINQFHQIQIRFTLGHYYHAIKDYKTAFTHFYEGNERNAQRLLEKKGAKTRDELARIDISDLESIRSTFTPELLAKDVPTQKGDDLIFIVGMPRSGTTLVEQILGAHDDVQPLGEKMFFMDTAQILKDSNSKKVRFPHWLHYAESSTFEKVGHKILRQYNNIKEDGYCITDKMPSNFRFIGLIRMIFPEAKIIHCQRDPIDVCLSCYMQLFQYGHYYIYDMNQIAKYYNAYQDLMAHWYDILPANTLYTLNYEELVNEPESTIAKLLNYLGLDWDSRCMEHDKYGESALTASNVQVREPLNFKSVHKWHKYREHITPLIKNLSHHGKA